MNCPPSKPRNHAGHTCEDCGYCDWHCQCRAVTSSKFSQHFRKPDAEREEVGEKIVDGAIERMKEPKC